MLMLGINIALSAGDLYKDMRSISQQKYGQLGQQGHMTLTCDSWEGQVIRNPFWSGCAQQQVIDGGMLRWQLIFILAPKNVTGH